MFLVGKHSLGNRTSHEFHWSNVAHKQIQSVIADVKPLFWCYDQGTLD